MSGLAGKLGLLLAVLAVSSPTVADNWKFGGHLKYRYTHTEYRTDDVNAVFGDASANDHDADVRLKADGLQGPWDFSAHYELLAISGDTVQTRRNLAAAGLLSAGTVSGMPDDRQQLFDLTHESTDGDRSAMVQRMDRLSIGYSSDPITLRFGRQAVSWGNGLVFQTLDFINPFAPTAIDKEYKTGNDMLTGLWTIASGGDVQAIWLPRRDLVTHDVESDQSTYAVKWRLRFGEFDIDMLGARHFDQNVFGAGVVRSIGGAVWRLDASRVDLGADSAWSLVTNVDYSWVWGGKNMYGFVEYFRNGFGETDPSQYATPNSALSQRIARGELYTLGRDYVAAGVQIEATPLLNFFTNAIWNMHDSSYYLQVRGVYDWFQDTPVTMGVNVPFGERGDEFGGIPVPLTSMYLAPGRSVYIRIAKYF